MMKGLLTIFVVGILVGSMSITVHSVADIVADQFFDEIIGQSVPSCTGRNFYARAAFLEALDEFLEFGTADDIEREIAAFFAHVTHETGHFCYIEEIASPGFPNSQHCDPANTWYPCNPEKSYYGRGLIQLSWNFNYGPVGECIWFDGLNSPETVANDPVISFKTTLWYWVTSVQPVIWQGFGATIRAINGAIECDSGNPNAVEARVKYYIDYCNQFGVDLGPKLRC